MYFHDLSKETQIDHGNHVRAIGWLSADQPFTTGDVPTEFPRRLRIFCENSAECGKELSWPFAMGVHECELCGEFWSGGNIGVPAGELLFVAPEMVAHYVDRHGYRPPEDFIAAVLACPLPGSEEYSQAVEALRRIREEIATHTEGKAAGVGIKK